MARSLLLGRHWVPTHGTLGCMVLHGTLGYVAWRCMVVHGTLGCIAHWVAWQIGLHGAARLQGFTSLDGVPMHMVTAWKRMLWLHMAWLHACTPALTHTRAHSHTRTHSSAASKKLTPASMHASSSSKDCASSFCWPMVTVFGVGGVQARSEGCAARIHYVFMWVASYRRIRRAVLYRHIKRAVLYRKIQ